MSTWNVGATSLDNVAVGSDGERILLLHALACAPEHFIVSLVSSPCAGESALQTDP